MHQRIPTYYANMLLLRVPAKTLGPCISLQIFSAFLERLLYLVARDCTWLHVSHVAVCTFCKPGEHMTQAPPVKRSDNNVIPLWSKWFRLRLSKTQIMHLGCPGFFQFKLLPDFRTLKILEYGTQQMHELGPGEPSVQTVSNCDRRRMEHDGTCLR